MSNTRTQSLLLGPIRSNLFPYSQGPTVVGTRILKSGCHFDVCLTVHHRYNKVENQLDAAITILLDFKTDHHVSGNSLPIIRSVRLWFTACGLPSSDCCRSEVRSTAARTTCHVAPATYFNPVWYTQDVPLATEPGISLIILPLVRILQRIQTHSSSFLTQRKYSCSNFVATSSLVLELLKKKFQAR